MMSKPRRRIVMAVVTAAVLVAVLVVAFPAAWHYRLFHDTESLHQVLSQTAAATSVSELERRLGPLERETEAESRDLIAVYRKMAETNPDGFPDGVTDLDGFILLPIPEDNAAMRLQVRDERLVNFNPRDFDQPYEPVRMLNTVD